MFSSSHRIDFVALLLDRRNRIGNLSSALFLFVLLAGAEPRLGFPAGDWEQEDWEQEDAGVGSVRRKGDLTRLAGADSLQC